ncbi:MAG: antitoxin VbhA family protein [Candidatus Ornithomonoglobus sp.]
MDKLTFETTNINSAIASFAVEGIHPSDEIKNYISDRMTGKINCEAQINKILSKYKSNNVF